MEISLNQKLVEDLREMFRNGAKVPELVEEIHLQEPRSKGGLLLVLYYFVQAFKIRLIQAKELGCWSYYGSRLNDEEINALIIPIIENARSSWDK